MASQTADLYRYFDATAITAFLYAKMKETVQKDIREELDYVARFQAALAAVIDAIDMPDWKVALLINLYRPSAGLASNRSSYSEARRSPYDQMREHVR